MDSTWREQFLVPLSLYNPVFTARKRSLGQGNKFTGVCLSTGGGVIPACTEADPPGTRHSPPGPDPPGPPPKFFIFYFFLPYGQHAGGTHPTGMHSCYHCDLWMIKRKWNQKLLSPSTNINNGNLRS